MFFILNHPDTGSVRRKGRMFRGVRALHLWLVGLMLLWSNASIAEFELNFQIQNQGSGYNDGYWTTSAYHSIGVENQYGPDSLTDQTPWVHTDNWHLPEIVYDPETGNKYYHILMGSMAEGFTQEFYIQVSSASHGGWHDPGDKNTPGSSSAGEGDYFVGANGVVDRWGQPTGGNGADPLNTDPNVDSGNGSGNPRKVIMRQIISDGEILMEFTKEKYDKKPRISQMINAPDISQFVEIDMRHIDYDDDTTAALMINETWLWGDTLPDASSAFFDAVSGAQDSNINAGQYRYVEGGGPGGSQGEYYYRDGGFDHEGIVWGNYYDQTLDNPWSFEAAKDALP